jgi:S-adenosylmethionine synthetase
MNLSVSLLRGLSAGEQPVEIVERKGLGHPDTICDILAENLSANLCRMYHAKFGAVLHHNVDKGLLFGGRSAPAFGGGEVLEPMEVFLVGRATMSFRGVDLPVEEVAVEGTRAWFREHFHALDPERHLRIRCLLRPGSRELAELFLRQARAGVALANDTSCGVGWAPNDDVERVVLGVERHLNSREMHERHPAFGQDIKVMAVRTGPDIDLTVACAFVDRHVRDMDDYLGHKALLARLAGDKAAELTGLPVAVTVNAADDPAAGSVYLTVTGTSGEAGDDGEVGRGNRVGGLITPCRPMNMEAAAGKNPVSHVGKIYNIAARRMAEGIVRAIDVVQEAQCFLVSRIGRPVHEPRSVEIRLRLADETILPTVHREAEAIAADILADTGNLWRQVLEGGADVC